MAVLTILIGCGSNRGGEATSVRVWGSVCTGSDKERGSVAGLERRSLQDSKGWKEELTKHFPSIIIIDVMTDRFIHSEGW